jgi:hypothetical protein
MPEAIIACHDTLRRGVLKGLEFRRMHFLRPSAPDGLGDRFNDPFDTFLRSSSFPFDTLLRSSCCSFVDRQESLRTRQIDGARGRAGDCDPSLLRIIARAHHIQARLIHVHNWLHRTGILNGLDARHRYGPKCYAHNGCRRYGKHGLGDLP